MSRARSPHAPWLILAIVSLPVFVGALDLTIISAVLPEVIVSLDLPVKEYLDQASWAVSGYLLAYAISMTFAGRLSDQFGRRTVYMVCLLIFMGGSYLVTAYDSPLLNEWLSRFYRDVLGQTPPRTEERYLYLVIIGRVIQALGAGAMVPVTIALVGDLFPPERRARPIGVVGAVDTLGWVLGHLYGGVMVRLFGEHGLAVVEAFAQLGLRVAMPSWETLFIINIPLSALALGGAWWALRDVQRPQRAERFDVPGTVLLVLALVGLNVGLGASPEAAGSAGSFEELRQGSGAYRAWLLAGAAVAFALFLVVEARAHHPLIRLGMFRRRNVLISSLTNLLVGFCLAIGLVSAPLLVNFRMESPTSQEVQHAAYVAGLLLSGLTIPMALAAIPGGWLSERRGYRLPTAVGVLLAALGFVLAGASWQSDTPYWLMGLQMTVIGIGLGLTISPVGTAVLNEVSEDERGIAAALILVLRLIGMTVAISSLTLYALERFDVLVADYMAGSGLNLEETLLASQTASLEAAVDVIKELQFIGAAVSLVAVMAALLMRGGRQAQEEAEAS
jgi:MFS family permease